MAYRKQRAALELLLVHASSAASDTTALVKSMGTIDWGEGNVHHAPIINI